MLCPNCGIGIRVDAAGKKQLGRKGNAPHYSLSWGYCPECDQLLIELETDKASDLIYPRRALRPVPEGVPEVYASDFREVCEVLPVSQRASAALSRRMLEFLLVREHGLSGRDHLANKVEEFINRKTVPPQLAAAIDAVRAVGNFGLHPNEDATSGEIIDVEPQEAELLIELLNEMLIFTFQQPARRQQVIDRINEKLVAIGKKPIQTPSSQ